MYRSPKMGTALTEEVKNTLAGCSYGIMKPIVPMVTNTDKKEQLFDSMAQWRRGGRTGEADGGRSPLTMKWLHPAGVGTG